MVALMTMFSHGTTELFEMSKYLMLGAFLTALIQTFVAQDSLSAIGQGPFISHVFMMGFAYLLSCAPQQMPSWLSPSPSPSLLAPYWLS